MGIEISEATVEEKPVLRRMLELYLYDLSEFTGDALGTYGEFGYNYLDLYWTEIGRHPFLVRSNGELAGFVLVGSHLVTEEAERTIAEFFILRKYRNIGFGRHVAETVFKMYPGVWEVRTFRANKPAVKFWETTISNFSGGNFKYLENGFGSWGGPLWVFNYTEQAAGGDVTR